MRNRFFLSHRSALPAVEFAPEEFAETGFPADNHYFHRILSEINRLEPHLGLTFYVTFSLDYFEERLRDSVVFLVGDEMYQTPVYAPLVRAIFKTGGARPNKLRELFKVPASIGCRLALREARDRTLAFRRNRRRRRLGYTNPPARTYGIPLGYWLQRDVPWVPFEQRTIDVFFAGTVISKGRFSVRPSAAARAQMGRALAAASAALPQLRMEYLRPGQRRLTPEEYSATMMNSRIALCPRGNFDETCRLFEAARSGCALVSEPLPSRWYYDGVPATQLSGWRELTEALRKLTADPALLTENASRTRQWWLDSCSEPAVARYVLDRLAELP